MRANRDHGFRYAPPVATRLGPSGAKIQRRTPPGPRYSVGRLRGKDTAWDASGAKIQRWTPPGPRYSVGRLRGKDTAWDASGAKVLRGQGAVQQTSKAPVNGYLLHVANSSQLNDIAGECVRRQINLVGVAGALAV